MRARKAIWPLTAALVCGLTTRDTAARPGPGATLPIPTASEADAAPRAPEADPARAALPYPHPLIVEVLYAVPTGNAGDANRDGVRHAGGDEFVELVNPHDRPIQLLGYTLSDGSQSEKSRLRFTFPACELAPGGVAVVFNGNAASWAGPVGDAKAGPARGNEKFGGALVFSMRVTSTSVAFGNQGDEVVLSAPNSRAVQRLRWGAAAESAKTDSAAPLEETLPTVTRCSVMRAGVEAGSPWRPHSDADKRPFSPGEVGALENGGKRP